MASNPLEEVKSVNVDVVAPDGEDNRRYCWVCFVTEEEEPDVEWVQPCKCKGTTKWVHQKCLQRWVDEKQKGDINVIVSCPQCNSDYIIAVPKMGPLIVILDAVDNVIYKICPFVAAGVVVGAIYWTATTYGAITVMQVMGHRQAMAAMERCDPMLLLVGLPTIPVALVLGKMIRWEEAFLTFLRKHSQKVPIFRRVLPAYLERERNGANNIPPMTDTISATRVLCSALILPTVANICGKLFFEQVPSNIQRTFLGGLAFLAAKGLLKIYHKHQEYVRQGQRIVLDYIPPEEQPPALQ